MKDTIASLYAYFPKLTLVQQKQFAAMQSLYAQWNARINLISRRDFVHFYLHHVIHSLGIAKVMAFAPQSKVLDVGTGGGFPGIPLAIYFPEVHFCLVESIQKKTLALDAIVTALGLKNVIIVRARIEAQIHNVDYIVGRAVAPLPTLIQWLKGQCRIQQPPMPKSGLFYLGASEPHPSFTKPNPGVIQSYLLKKYFKEPYFRTKAVLFVPAKSFQ